MVYFEELQMPDTDTPRQTELQELIRQAQARYDALSPEGKAEHDRLQRESFVRSFMPAGHNMETFAIQERLAKINKDIVEYLYWGAWLTELSEERDDLESELRRRGHE